MHENLPPHSVYAEMTPNPETVKFVSDQPLLLSHESAEFSSMAEAKGYSPLAEKLFQFPFVKKVFLVGNMVSVTKTPDMGWDLITMELREFIRDFLNDGGKALVQMPEAEPDEVQEIPNLEPHEMDDAIRAVLEEFVRPAVENDGGAIELIGTKERLVYVAMKGACSGCPSSTATLKGGIERLLREHVHPELEVLASEQ